MSGLCGSKKSAAVVSTHARTPTEASPGMEEHQHDDVPASLNFWDIGGYKRVTKRITDGSRLCDELIKMLAERASIEKSYSKGMLQWADRWIGKMEGRVNEYGSLKDGWVGVTDEAKAISQIHAMLQSRLEGELPEKIKGFQKQHFPKSFMHHKSYKRATSAFEKAQSHWAKRKSKVMKHQKNYRSHMDAAQGYLKQANATGVDADVAKLKAQAKKEEKEAAKSREKLRERVHEMTQYGEVYRREMMIEFRRCQEEEGGRIRFFKEALIDYHRQTDISSAYTEAHAVLRRTLDEINDARDLERYERELGPGMPLELPAPMSSSPPPAAAGSSAPPAAPPMAQHDPPPSYSEDPPPPPPGPAAQPLAQASSDFDFDDDAHSSTNGAGSPPLVMPGMAMRALYDYEGNNPDELSFAFDDKITVLPQPNDIEEGWVKGQLDNGKVGIFPGNYAEPE